MDQVQIAEALRAVPLFASLSPGQLEAVADNMKEVHFEAGRVVAKQGDEGVGFHLIVEGEAEVSGEAVPTHSIGRRAYFGEIGLIDGGPRSATVTATTDLTTLSLVTWDFQPLLNDASFSKGLLLGLCAIVRQYREAATT